LTSYSLAKLAAIENLTFTGSSPATIAGNALGNILTGAGGSDRLTGGKGADTLVGGASGDTFIFAAGDSGQASNYDIISDFTKGALGSGDLIDYVQALSLGGNANAATATESSIN
jgi:Ca2+-binding RTX toxin-like protein